MRLVHFLRRQKKKWIQIGYRRACTEFKHTIRNYQDVINYEGRLHKRILKSFIRWKNGKLKKQEILLLMEIQRYRRLNKSLDKTDRQLKELLNKTKLESARQKIVLDRVQRAASTSFAFDGEFETIEDLADYRLKKGYKKLDRISKSRKSR